MYVCVYLLKMHFFGFHYIGLISIQVYAFNKLIDCFFMVLAEANLYFTQQVSGDAGVDTLIPLPLQAKDNPILQHLLPTLLNPTVLGEFMLTF